MKGFTSFNLQNYIKSHHDSIKTSTLPKEILLNHLSTQVYTNKISKLVPMAMEGDGDSNHSGCNLTDPAEPPTTLTDTCQRFRVRIVVASGSCSSLVFVVVVVAAGLAVWFGFIVGGCARRCGVVHSPSLFTCWVEVVSGAG
jgi:hypothetical protein